MAGWASTHDELAVVRRVLQREILYGGITRVSPIEFVRFVRAAEKE